VHAFKASPVGFRRMMGRLGKAAKLPFPVHPHMLRYAAGFKLAPNGSEPHYPHRGLSGKIGAKRRTEAPPQTHPIHTASSV
jgi:hypothetical protein